MFFRLARNVPSKRCRYQLSPIKSSLPTSNVRSLRFCSEAPTPGKPTDAPQSSERVMKVLENMKSLNFIEIMALGKELQKMAGITDEQLFAGLGGGGGGGRAAPAASETTAAPVEEAPKAPAAGPAVADIKLLGFPEGAKFPVLKEIRKLKPGMNLVDSKKLVEELPQIIGKRISGEELDEWKKALDAVGAQYELVP